MTAIGKAKNGSPTIIKDGSYLLSSYGPEHEIDRFVERQGETSGRFFILFGSALGYTANALEKKGVNKKDIFVFEPDPVCREFIANSPRDYIILDKGRIDPGQFENRLIERKRPCILALESFIKSYPAEYSDFTSQISGSIGIAAENIKVSSFFSKVWFINFIRNLALFLCDENCYYIKNLKTENRMPVLVSAAGPSLDKSLYNLRQRQGSLIIISVLPAVKTLLDNSIKPDFIVLSDGGVYNKLHWSGIPGGIPVLASIYSSSALLSSINNPRVFYDLEEGLKGMDFSLEYPSVAIDAGILANRITSGGVVFAGFDLAYSLKAGSHSRGNLIRERERTNSDRLLSFQSKTSSFLQRTGLSSAGTNKDEYFTSAQFLLVKELAEKMFAGNSFVAGGTDFLSLNSFDNFKDIELKEIDTGIKAAALEEIKKSFSHGPDLKDRIIKSVGGIMGRLSSFESGLCSRIFVRESLMDIPLKEPALYYKGKIERLFQIA